MRVFFNSDFKENLARSKPVWGDQPWGDATKGWGADKAVDGRHNDRSAEGGQCVISENERMRATLRVDLKGVCSISHIDIYYRTGNTGSPYVYCMVRNII